jgi:hypothetical protein
MEFFNKLLRQEPVNLHEGCRFSRGKIESRPEGQQELEVMQHDFSVGRSVMALEFRNI